MSQDSPQKKTLSPATPKTSTKPGQRPSSSSPMSDPTVILKVSNSDDEDSVAKTYTSRRNTSASKNCTIELSRESLSFEGSFDSRRPAVEYGTGQIANPTSKLTATIRSDKPTYTTAEKDSIEPPLLNEGSFDMCSFQNTENYVQVGEDAISRSRRLSMIPPEVLSCYSGRAPFIARKAIETPAGRAPVPLQLPRESGLGSLPSNDGTKTPRCTPNSIPRADHMLPTSNAEARRAQPTRQPPRRDGVSLSPPHTVGAGLQTPSAFVGSVSLLGGLGNADARRYIPTVTGSNKHTMTPPRTDAMKRPKFGFAPDQPDVRSLKYRTIKCIKMPLRSDLTPGQEPPDPSPHNLPYGDTVDYKTSMLIYWLDEQELTYSEAARLYRLKFRGETASDDTLRKKHIDTLQSLAMKYGLRPEDDVEKPGKKVLRRGQQSGRRYSSIGSRNFDTTAATSQVNGDSSTQVHLKRVTQPSASRGFLTACICVWKDTMDASFDQIQQRLASEFGWELGTNTVQKLYYSERTRVYNVHETLGKAIEDELTATGDAAEAVEGRNGAHTTVQRPC